MSPIRAFLIHAAALGSFASAAPVGVNDVYQECGGILVMEAERSPSSLGSGANRWELYTPGQSNYVDGAAQEAHLEFQGNSSNGDTPQTPLTYRFKINESGYYHLHLRARQRLAGAAADKNNDCWVKVNGVNGATFGAGPNAGGQHMDDAPVSLLTTYTKMYVSSPVTWGWANLLDAGGSSNKRWPVYYFNAGSTYVLTIAGRSINFNYDRILFRKSTIVDTSAKSTAIPESALNATSSATPAISGVTLVNADTDRDLGPLTHGAKINLATFGPNLNLRADSSPPVLGSVRFTLDGNADYRLESLAPYTIGGDNIWDDYLPWTPTVGNHTLTVTAYSAANGGGTAGTPVTFNFSVINEIPPGSPVANAGSDRAVVLPTTSVALSGSGSDSGGSIASYKWQQVGGPAIATLAAADTVAPTVSDLAHGTYKFRLTVTDNSGLTSFDDAVVTVTAPAGAPVANAGVDKAVALPASSVTLNGTGTDPANQIYAYLWTQVSGPSNATRSGESSLNLTASNLIAGTYVFRLRIYSETGLIGADDATVTVSAATGVPVANAGADASITLPVSSLTINGSGTDPGGSISAYSWSQISGPGTASLSGANTASLTASSLIQGSYVFRLTVTDNNGLTGSDDVNVTVNPTSGGSGQSVTRLVLVNADTDQDIGDIVGGSTIDLAATPRLSVRAETSPMPVGSVRFSFDDNVNLRTESGPPYTINGDTGGVDYTAWVPPLGTHTLAVTPFTQSGATGTAGSPMSVVFTVIDSSLTGDPQANAGTDKSIVLPTSSVTLNGSSIDSDGSITAQLWTQVSGPAAASLAGATTANLTASGLQQGSYVFRYTVTDNSGKTDSDEVSVFVLPASVGSALISGELKKWHKVTLDFAGPNTSESATPNPFTDYRLNVTFTHLGSGKSYVVPGYYAADGNAANSSATSGNVWRVHFSPDETGAWSYTASFRSGSNVATNASPTAGNAAGFFDGDSGNFSIAPTDKSGRDLRGKGRLQYVGKHHLRFAETGEYFMKAGVDAPENLLAYADFDGDFKTDGQGDNYIKDWAPHAGDWQVGDPSWGNGKGKGLIGAINYLASEGLNAFSFLTLNIAGDDKNVFPYTTYNERTRLDVSKLDQWGIVFEYGTKKGMYLHFKTQETENELMLDGGDTGNQRKLYYRELIARFGCNLALNWNLGEEINSASLSQKQSWAQYFYDSDPYHHPIVIHNGANHYNMLGSASKLTGFSLQLNAPDFTDMFVMTKDYLDRSEDADRPWVVACDEPGDAAYSLRPDSDPGTSHVDARKNALWGNIMAGGAGCEFYFGYLMAHSDLTCNDFRSRDSFWDVCRHALEFLKSNAVPFEQMKNQNALVSGNGANANRCLAKTGDAYLVQLHAGGSATLNLSAASGSFTTRWFNPRTGAVTGGSNLTGGSTVSLGSPPGETTQDWIVLVRSTNGGGGTNTAPIASAGADKSAFFSGTPVNVSLTGTVTDDGLPAGLALTRSWSVVSGPAGVLLANANTATVTATFPALGTYVLRFTASDTELSSSDEVMVTIQAPGGSSEHSFGVLHDAYLENGSNNNLTQLRVEKSSTRTRTAYLQFDLGSAAPISGFSATPGSAVIRLAEGDDTSSGTMTLRLYAAASNDWTESNITGSNAPAKGAQLGVFTGDVTDGQVIEFDVGTHIGTAGKYSFILEADSSTRDVSFASKENATPSLRPSLVLSNGSNAPPSFAGYSESIPVNSQILIPYSLILAGASDPDGDAVSLVVASDSSEAGGYVTMGTDSLSYRPPPDFTGTDGFLLTVQDGRGGFTSALLSLTVTPEDGIGGAPPPVLDKIGPSQMRVRFHGVPGATYRFQRSTNFSTWTTLYTVTAGEEGMVEYTDGASPVGRAFYRVQSP
ncbi:PKD domain-containing protein [Luteolibacter luteus]|uniref:Tandem-95 repeat protein n=1 Tax=Luteolibacter luteus TaxID=2728835 RepID=A0A858RIQ7_9BACT|nr:tandem-95 repeat protein [Luteolibacter luteus]QJE96378.1 tandem-95 repeat protein [Luteolibacter luteus]